MTKLVLSSLAILALGAPAPAGNGGDDDWIQLDQEINSLSASLEGEGSDIDVGAVIRSSYVDLDKDLISDAATSREVAGFVFQDVDVWLEGSSGSFDWRVSMDFDGGQTNGDEFFNTVFSIQDLLSTGETTVADFLSDNPSALGAISGQRVSTGGGSDLEDAYGTMNITDNFRVTFGQFKAPVLLSQMVDPDRQLFINRTLLGGAFDDWQLGAMFHGDVGDFAWFLAIQNGNDGLADQYRYTGRAEYYIGGGAGGGKGSEGPRGAPDSFGGTVGVTYRDDDGLNAGLQIAALDGAMTMGRFSAAVEIVDFDLNEDGTLVSGTVGYQINDQWEAAVRYEDLDDILEIRKITAGINYYHGPQNARWSLNVSDFEADQPSIDGSIIEVGLSVGSSRS